MRWARGGFALLSLLIGMLPLLTVATEHSPPAPATTRGDQERRGDAVALLRQMVAAPRQLSYEGTFVYMRGDTTTTLRILHRSGPEGELERLHTLDGPRREVIREQGRVVALLPDDGDGVISSGAADLALPVALPEDLTTLQRLYRLQIGETTRIAGHQAQQVTVEPVDALRYGYRFWLAEESGLLLQTELYDGEEVLERVLFTALQLRDTIPMPQLRGASNDAIAQLPEPVHPIHTESQPARWQALTPPTGFALDFSGRHTLLTPDVTIDHLVFSDGLASVSLFIEPDATATNETLAPVTRYGALHACVRQLPGYRITAVGEVPAVTVQQFALAARPIESTTPMEP